MKQLMQLLCCMVITCGLHAQKLQEGEKEKLDPDKFLFAPVDTKTGFRLDETFYFNKKIYFNAKSATHQVSAYCYCNTKNGLTAVDKEVGQQLGGAYLGMDFMIKLNDGNHLLYQTHSGSMGKLASVIREGFGFLPHYLKDMDDVQYLKDHFETDGEKTYVGDKSQFASVRYQGVNMDGGHMHALLSGNAGITLNPSNQRLIMCPFGVGYVFFDYKTQLISGWESDDFIARVEKIEDVNFTFSGKDYQAFQQKADVKIAETKAQLKSSGEKELDVIGERQRQAAVERRSGGADINEARRRAIDVELLDIKKQIVMKRKAMETKAVSKSEEVSEKQGSIESMQKGMYAMFADNTFLDIQKLELKEDILKNEKTLLSNNATAKTKDASQKKMDCSKRKLEQLEVIYAAFTALDSRYADQQQLFNAKLNLYTTHLVPVLSAPCPQ